MDKLLHVVVLVSLGLSRYSSKICSASDTTLLAGINSLLMEPAFSVKVKVWYSTSPYVGENIECLQTYWNYFSQCFLMLVWWGFMRAPDLQGQTGAHPESGGWSLVPIATLWLTCFKLFYPETLCEKNDSYLWKSIFENFANFFYMITFICLEVIKFKDIFQPWKLACRGKHFFSVSAHDYKG